MPDLDLAASSDHDVRGVSVNHICTKLVAAVSAAGLSPDEASMSQIDGLIRTRGSSTRCPRDGQMGCAYVDAIGADSGSARYIVSYAAADTVGTIQNALSTYCDRHGLDPSSTHVWLRGLCVNHHRTDPTQETNEERVGVPSVIPKLRTELERRLHTIGHLLVLMTPITDPRSIKTAESLFEIFVTVDLQRRGSSCKLEVMMVAVEDQEFHAQLHTHMNMLALALDRVDMEHSEASPTFDKPSMLLTSGLVEGYDYVNRIVVEGLGTWLAQQGQCALDLLPVAHRTFSPLLASVVRLLHAVGKLAEAELLCREQVVSFRDAHGNTHGDTLDAIASLSAILQTQKKYGEAETLAREVLVCRRAKLGDRHLDTLHSIGALGSVLRDQGKLDDALKLYREQLEGYRATLGNRDPETLAAIHCLAGLLQEAQVKLDSTHPCTIC